MIFARAFSGRLPLSAILFLLPLAEPRVQSAAPEVVAPNRSVAPDQGGYTLFQPTPREFLRELSTDRPDKTESPYNEDAGLFQLEMDFANFTAAETGGEGTRAWNIAPINLQSRSAQPSRSSVHFRRYLQLRTHDRRARPETMRRSGVGDFMTRLKINLWGHNGGATAFTLLPFVKLPTNTNGLGNNAVEGGALFPLAVKLPGEFGLGTETGFALFRHAEGTGRHGEFIQSITVGHAIAGKLSGDAEFFSSLQHRAAYRMDRNDRCRRRLPGNGKHPAQFRLQFWRYPRGGRGQSVRRPLDQILNFSKRPKLQRPLFKQP